MIDGKSIPVGETASTGHAQERRDFSNLQGFQVAGPGSLPGSAAEHCGEASRDALRLELETRAQRFHQAVDASILLANDGVIRWLGDPVAKLTLGPDLLTPRAVILADDALPEGARDIVSVRLELWLAATARRLLGPLFALQALQDESEKVRDLAGKIARSLGILDRDPIRGQIKALDQNARATLRKHGVRFGAYYIYVPVALKPAARILALQLWGLQNPGVSADSLAQTLAPLASSGRTSLPCDPLISRESYRVAGFRPCGDRIVRVDIVERLADMIRAAFIERSPSGDSGHPRGGRGFVVSGQMTSLTGCSGEQFASILRSLDFECVEVRRSELLSDASVAGHQPMVVPPVISAHPDSPNDGASRSVHEQARDQVTDPATGSPEAAQAAAPDQQVEIAMQETAVAESRSHEPEGESRRETTSPPAAILPLASAPSSEEEPVSVDTVVVWRPAPRTRPHRQKVRRLRQDRNDSAKTELLEAAAANRDSSGPTHRKREFIARRRAEQPASKGAEHPDDQSGSAERPNDRPTDKKNRQVASNRDMPLARPDSGLKQRATVDPNSPFAKLVELRSLLEAQAKKRP